MLIHVPKTAESTEAVLARRPISPAKYMRANGPGGRKHRSGAMRYPVSNRELRDQMRERLARFGRRVSSERWVSLREGAAVMGILRFSGGLGAIVRNSTDGAFGLTVQAGIEIGGVPLIGPSLVRRRQTSEDALEEACFRFCQVLPDGWTALRDEANLLRQRPIDMLHGVGSLCLLAGQKTIPLRFLGKAEFAWNRWRGKRDLWTLYRTIAGVAREWSPERQREILEATRDYLVTLARLKRSAA